MSQTAKSGFRNEDWVVDQFNNHHTSLYGTAWLDAMEYPHPKKVCAQTTRRMGFFNKADVLVLVDDHVEWVSVKKFTASFNQLDKRWVDDFARLWKMPDSVISSLKMYCGEDGYGPADVSGLASHTRDARRFYMDELPYDKQEQVLAFLNKNKKRIIRNVMAGRGRAAARWMLVVEERRGMPRKSAIASITATIRHYSTGRAYITKKGNLKLGRITIQRKGGDGGKKTAQMLQFKFSPKELFDMDAARAFEDSVPIL